jgi:hypothetical protein
MKTYIKPSGAQLDVNADCYQLADDLGWLPLDEFNKAAKAATDKDDADKPRRGRPPKNQD